MAAFFHTPVRRLALAVSLASVATGVSAAQPVLEEIIVTSQLRTESIQDVSVSVNVLSGDKLLSAGIAKVEDLQAYVPNFTMSETGIGTNIYMRGIGSGINQGFEQSVGMYVDGVSYGRGQLSRAPFLDLSRVEVLRGPQNILYGKNSIAGAMSLHTAKPGEDFEGLISLTYEPEFGEEVADIVLSGALSDQFGLRFAHRSRQLDGYIKNIDSGQDEPNRDEQTTRLTFVWTPSDAASVSLKFETGDFDVAGRQVEIIGDSGFAGGPNWGQVLLSLNPLANVTPAAPTPLSILNNTADYKRSANRDFSLNSTQNITLKFDYSFENFDFSSTTASLEYDYHELCDCDFTSAEIFTVESKEDYSQVSQEFRLTSTTDGMVDWVTGVYFSSTELDFNDRFATAPSSPIGNIFDVIVSQAFGGAFPAGAGQQIANLAVPRTFKQDADLWSVFLQASVNVSDTSRLILGGRYSSEEKSARRNLTYVNATTGAAIPFNELFTPNTSAGIDYLLGRVLQVARHDVRGDREESKFAPAVTYELDVNENAMAYATWTRGFKSGGYDVRSNVSPNGYSVVNPFSSALSFTVPPGSFEYDQERSETVEFGIKSTLLDGAMELNVAAFRTEYEDLQVSIFDGVLGFNVGNAAEATSQGIELDWRWALTENITTTGALAWLDFEFDKFPDGQCTQLERIIADINDSNQRSCDYSGKTNQYVADISGYIGVNHQLSLGDALRLASTLDVVYTSSYNPSQNLDPLVEQDGYAKVNLRVALSDADDVWELAILAKNLTDEQIITYANDTPLSANLARSIGHYGFLESPRTVAIQGSYRF